MAEGGLWLEEEPDGPPTRRPLRRRGALVAAAAAAAVLLVAAVPVALVLSGSSPGPAGVRATPDDPHPGHGPAEHAVLSALSATTDTGSFEFSYSIHGTPASASATTTPTTECPSEQVPVPAGPSVPGGGATGTDGGTAQSPYVPYPATVTGPTAKGSGSGATSTVGGSLPPGYVWRTERICNSPTAAPDPVVQGSGVINTNPLAMVASADIGQGLDVTVRVDGSSVYEEGTVDTGLAPSAGDGAGSGSGLPQFAGITEGTLGNREGAVAMMGMASPTGYLDLIQPAITAATQTGTGTVDSVPVTDYQVTNDLSQLAGAPGTSASEAQTISAALGLLDAQGYTSNDVVVSIDGSGFIRHVRSTDAFADGGTVTLEATFSDFGCAGTVLMPGQAGSGEPPANCTPPGGAPPTTSTTTGPASDSSPTTAPPATSTSAPATTASAPPPEPTTTMPPGGKGTATASTEPSTSPPATVP